MYAFAAIAWDTRDREASAFAATLQAKLTKNFGANSPSVQSAGFAMYHLSQPRTKNRILPLESSDGSSTGAVYGTLFRRDAELKPRKAISRLSPDEENRLIQDHGESLIRDYWGSYIGIFRSEGCISIVADPTNSIPCFYIDRQGVRIIFSHLEKCQFSDLGELTLDREFISHLLIYDKIQNGQTGFSEIKEVLGGQRVSKTGPNSNTDLLWDPRRFATEVNAPSVKDAADKMRRSVEYVTQSWAMEFENIAVNLSGGLDSTIVLSCLNNSGYECRINPIHYSVGSDDYSEASFARIAAAYFGSKLDDVVLDAAPPLPSINSHPLSTRPHRHFLGSSMENAFQQISLNPEAIFTGQGGDHLFQADPTNLGFADFIFTRGFEKAWLEELLNSAILSEESIWSVLRSAMTTISAKGRPSAMVEGLSKKARSAAHAIGFSFDGRTVVPEWAQAPAGTPPAKFDQVSRLLHLFLVREPLDRPIYRNFINPLISQPLIEYCLQLPSYVLCAHGVSRGLARLAFKDRIPNAIAERIIKGDTSNFFVNQLERDGEAIRQELSDGELVSQGFISEATAKSLYNARQIHKHPAAHRLLFYYAAEGWLRSYTQRARRPSGVV